MAKLVNDTASYQPDTRSYFNTLFRNGSRGDVVKMTDGTDYLNPSAGNQVYNALKVFGSVSVYHFLEGNVSAISQARYFCHWMRVFELDSSTRWGLDVEALNLPWVCDYMINQFINYMKSHGYPNGKVVYGSASWFNHGRIHRNVIDTDNIWVAAYGTDEPGVDNTGVWQYSDNFRGLNTDVSLDFKNVFVPVAKPKAKRSKVKVVAKAKPRYWRKTGKYQVVSSISIYKDLYDKQSTQVDLDKGSTFYAQQVFTFKNGATRFKTDVGYISANQKFVRPIK